MSKIYVASSWRNKYQQETVKILRAHGHEVYDFKNPPNNIGFSWKQVGLEVPDSDLGGKGNSEVPIIPFLNALSHPRAQEGFKLDFDAMNWATHVLMLLPCGKSAHLELGWATGAGKKTAIYLDVYNTPELLYLCVDTFVYSTDSLLEWADS